MADSDNPSRLSVALAKAATLEIQEDVRVRAGLDMTNEVSLSEAHDRWVAIIARYIDMVR
jgi:hypothetical protein